MCEGCLKSRYPESFDRYTARVMTRTSLSRSGGFGDAAGVGDAAGGIAPGGGGTGNVSFAFANSSAVEPLPNEIILPSGDHCGPPAPRGTVVNCQASRPSIDNMKSCGGSGRPSFSGDRTKQMNLPSGDQRGEESRGPAVSCRDSPVAVDTVQIAVSYPSFL